MITQQALQDALAYAPDTGEVRWRTPTSKRAKAGQLAGGVNRDGYRWICIAGRKYQAHRLIWLYVHGEWPKGQIDHINGDRGDNRLNNLRDVPRAINCQNRHRARSDSTTGLLGVRRATWKDRYQANITRAGKTVHLGSFDTAEQAHAAYLLARGAA